MSLDLSVLSTSVRAEAKSPGSSRDNREDDVTTENRTQKTPGTGVAHRAPQQADEGGVTAPSTGGQAIMQILQLKKIQNKKMVGLAFEPRKHGRSSCLQTQCLPVCLIKMPAVSAGWDSTSEPANSPDVRWRHPETRATVRQGEIW